jgi:hypothetical protein
MLLLHCLLFLEELYLLMQLIITVHLRATEVLLLQLGLSRLIYIGLVVVQADYLDSEESLVVAEALGMYPHPSHVLL